VWGGERPRLATENLVSGSPYRAQTCELAMSRTRYRMMLVNDRSVRRVSADLSR
jgi:hypothetical protein